MLQENEEIHTLLSVLHESGPEARQWQGQVPEYGSDDEEYASLCLEAVSAVEARCASPADPLGAGLESCQDMDISVD